MVENKSHEITEDEATLYDRQIRLWGLESQKRLRAAKILVLGLQGLGAEVCKNIVLAGVKSLVMMDDGIANEGDFINQFLIPREEIGKNRATASLERVRQLNPMVEVSAETESVDEKADPFFSGFDVIIATQCTVPQIVRLNQISRMHGIKFFSGDIFGLYGYCFTDLQIHKYSMEIKVCAKPGKKISLDTPQETVTKEATTTFVPFQDILDIDWKAEENAKTLKKLSNNYFIMRVLQAFRSKEKRNPDPSRRSEDFALLQKFRDETLENLGVATSRVPDDILEQTFGQVSPVCAIVGGVLAQEVIKAVSQRDPPHNNTFFFDPESCAGKVECIGY